MCKKYNMSQRFQEILCNTNLSISEQNKRLLDTIEKMLKRNDHLEMQIKGLCDRTYKKYVAEAVALEKFRRTRKEITTQIMKNTTDYELGARQSKVLELSSAYRKLFRLVTEFTP